MNSYERPDNESPTPDTAAFVEDLATITNAAAERIVREMNSFMSALATALQPLADWAEEVGDRMEFVSGHADAVEGEIVSERRKLTE